MPTPQSFGLFRAALPLASIFLVAGAAGDEGSEQDAAVGVALRGATRGSRRLDHNVDSRHASTHLHYTSPLQEGYPVAWYNSLTPKHSSESTYFATNTQGFGYMGLQQVEERGMWFQGTAIFSIWDDACNELMDEADCPPEHRAEIIECGEMAICSRFGNEGTGLRSMIRFNEWELEQSYGFLVQAVQVSAEKVRYEGYFHAPELGGWVLLSKLQVSVGSKPWYLHGMGSFVEQWDEKSGEDVRWGRFGPAFVEAGGSSDAWTQITRASFSHTAGAGEDTTHVHANVTNGGQQWGMGIGGTLVKGVEQAAVLDIYQASAVPQELELFSRLRREGQLPGGCLGETCTRTMIQSYVQDSLSKKYFPIMAIALVAVLCMCCSMVCWCRPCGRKVKRERKEQQPEPGSKSTIDGVLDVGAQDEFDARDVERQDVFEPGCPGAGAVAKQPPQAAEEQMQPRLLGSQPSMRDAFDAVVQGVIEPMYQGAVVVAEQVAQAAEEHQPAMLDAVDAVVQGVFEPMYQGAVVVAEQVAQAAEEHQPTMLDAVDAVVQGVFEPMYQGAVVVAEQVAQAVEPGASSPSLSRAGSPLPKSARAGSLPPGFSERPRSPERQRAGSPSPGPSRRPSPSPDGRGSSPSPAAAIVEERRRSKEGARRD